MKGIIFVLFLFSISYRSFSQEEISAETVRSYFEEIRTNSENYKELWNTDLYGPILLVDPQSGMVYSNYPDSSGVLKRDGEIFSGILPAEINTANTAIEWNGKLWAMIMLPLPGNKPDRLDLLSHELFHRSQPQLGFKMNNPGNSHLDQKEGRIYLRLELEALKHAVNARSKSEIRRDLTNALYFRNYRYSVYQNSKSSENSLELNEGLASYTGIFMSGRNNDMLKEYFNNRIDEFQSYPTFVRSFAYLTVPLYGFFLSKYEPYWNRQVHNNTNLTDFFCEYLNLKIPGKLGKEVIDRYGMSKIYPEENKREERIKRLISEYKTTFIEKPHLEIRFEKMSVSFDPRNIMPLEGYGTVYPTLRVSDNWGILTVSEGALLGTNWDKITVSEPTSVSKDKVTGNGWVIELKEGYVVEKNSSDQNYSLKKSASEK